MSNREADASQPAPTSPSTASPSSVIKRCRTAVNLQQCCRTCRLRKVKCGGNPGNERCSNCSRLELICSFSRGDKNHNSVSRTAPTAKYTEAGTLRKRAQRACNPCHINKTKCSADVPRCKRCQSMDLPCEYGTTKRKITRGHFSNYTSKGAASPISMLATREGKPQSSARQLRTSYGLLLADLTELNVEEQSLRREFLLQHMDLFMEYFYYMPCLGFCNPEVWYRDIKEMKISAPKAAAMCSLTCFFTHPGEEGRTVGAQLANSVDVYILSITNDFSEEMFMLLSIKTLFYLLHGSFAKAWNSFGMLSRLMIGMQVNWEKNGVNAYSFTQEETIRRMVWQVFSMDRLLAGGFEEYITCRPEYITVRLPCIEWAFRQNTHVLTDRLSDISQSNLPNLGLHGWQIRVIDLRHRIQVTTRRLMLPPDGMVVEASAIMSNINQLQNELSTLHLNFPQDLKLDAASMKHYMSAPERVGYIWLHLHVGVAHIDLYRFALPGVEQSLLDKARHLPPDFVQQSQRQVVAHALLVARFVNSVYEASKDQPSSSVIRLYGDYSISHMSTHALQVLLVALQYDIFHDIAANTTVPSWASAKTNKNELHHLIAGILEATEGWSRTYLVTKQAYDSNRAMVDEFYRTNTIIQSRTRLASNTRLAGWCHSNLSPIAGSGTTKSDGSPSEQWQSVPRLSSNSQRAGLGTFESLSGLTAVTAYTYGPPGIPSFLANARNECGLGAPPDFL